MVSSSLAFIETEPPISISAQEYLLERVSGIGMFFSIFPIFIIKP